MFDIEPQGNEAYSPERSAADRLPDLAPPEIECSAFSVSDSLMTLIYYRLCRIERALGRLVRMEGQTPFHGFGPGPGLVRLARRSQTVLAAVRQAMLR